MKPKVFKSNFPDFLRVYLPQILLTLIIALICTVALWQVEVSGSSEGRRLLEESIQNAVVSHYAIYGSYPPDLNYIEERYGIHIERSKYAVFYEIFAPNIIPEVTVVEIK